MRHDDDNFDERDDDEELGADEADDEELHDDEEVSADAADEVPEVSRKVRRRRRRTRPRSRTIAMKRLTREELRVGALLYPPVDVPRPSSSMTTRLRSVAFEIIV